MLEILTLVSSLLALIFSGFALGFCIYTYGELIGIKKSTHKVEMVPASSLLTGDEEKPKEEEEVNLPERPENYPNY